MVNRGPGRNGSKWRGIQAQCMADGEYHNTPCYLCGKPINYAFTRDMPRHRLAGTAHHIIGLEQGGDPTDPDNLAPAHRGCNSAEGNRVRAATRRALRAPVPTSRRW